MTRPNLLIILTDEWRAQSFGYAGDPDVQTPHIDAFARQSANFLHTVANCPVCCPQRGTLVTGLLPDKHGVFTNDVHLSQDFTSLADVFNAGGYDTGWIGKWHLDGMGRESYIPPERRQGFKFWQACECTHNYNHSAYFDNDNSEKVYWKGYDVFAQAEAAKTYMSTARDNPFALCLSWGPPHFPCHTAPDSYKALYDPESITLRPNVLPASESYAREELAGYYAHCTAIDDAFGDLMEHLRESGLSENTIVVFLSDHGDMMGSQGEIWKQRPWDESIRVPWLVRLPEHLRNDGPDISATASLLDFFPTLCGLCQLPCDPALPGRDLSPFVRGESELADAPQLIASYAPFGGWQVSKGGRAYRGLRNERYTYVRTLDGPWLLYDNESDPYQMTNRIGDPDYREVQSALDRQLDELLDRYDDAFLPGSAYIRKWGYTVDATGTVPYQK